MTDPDLPARTVSSERRQAVVDRLCEHFALDNMDAAELERRLDLAYAARTTNELTLLESDLPALRAESALESRAQTKVPARPGPAAAVDRSLPVSDRDLVVSICGATERKGIWTPPKTLTALSVMGGTTLDFRQAEFATPEVSVRLFTIMGGVEILVPPGVRVTWNGIALMGGVGTPEPTEKPGPDAPLIRLSGLVLMGGVDVVERRPHESAKEAKRRLKEAKEARRRLGSRS